MTDSQMDDKGVESSDNLDRNRDLDRRSEELRILEALSDRGTGQTLSGFESSKVADASQTASDENLALAPDGRPEGYATAGASQRPSPATDLDGNHLTNQSLLASIDTNQTLGSNDSQRRGVKRNRGKLASRRAMRYNVVEPPELPMPIDMGSRAILPCPVATADFLMGLREVTDLIVLQGWDRLLNVDANAININEENMREFYSNLNVWFTENRKGIMATFSMGGNQFAFTSLDVAKHMGVTVGLEDYNPYSSHQWMDDFDKESIVKSMCEDQQMKVAKGEVRASPFPFTTRVIHYILTKVVQPRLDSGGAIATLNDLILMDFVMRRVKLNLPFLVMVHMKQCRKVNKGLPYPTLVKSLLIEKGLYNDCNPKSCTTEFNSVTLKNLGFKFEGGSWKKKSEPSQFDCSKLDEALNIVKEMKDQMQDEVLNIVREMKDQMQDEVLNIVKEMKDQMQDEVLNIVKEIKDQMQDFIQLYSAPYS